MARAELDPERWVVFGGGCFGSFYVGQLIKAAARGAARVREIRVLDRDPACAVATRFADDPRVRVEVAEWRAFGPRLFALDHADDTHWVPAPLAPHVLYLWLRDAVGGRALRWDQTALRVPALPFAQVLETGSLALSHAPGMCPVHCIEPATCPLTRGARTWEMGETVAAALEGVVDEVIGLGCRHQVYGVGTIPVAEIQAARARIEGLATGSTVAVATHSGCHGIVDAFAVP